MAPDIIPCALVVDDDPNVGILLQEVLRDVGLSVKTLPDGSQALAEAKSLGPALIVLDIMMPGIDGLALCSLRR